MSDSEAGRDARIVKALSALGAAMRETDERTDEQTRPLLEALRKDYGVVLLLDDGSVAGLIRLIHTTGVCLGLDRYGWARRFCYSDPLKAIEVLCALKSEDEEPEGWVARRPERSYTCPRCVRVSCNPSDIAQGYCGACHDWTRS